MKAAYHILKPEDVPRSSRSTFALDVLEGLSKVPKQIPSLYFYDDRGSTLFQKITELEEYYLTRCEYEILRDNREAIGSFLGRSPLNLLELGAGDGRKTVLLIEHLLEEQFDFEYIPLDISEQAIQELTRTLSTRFPTGDFEIRGLVAEYFDGLRWLTRQSEKTNLVLFLGSNIGNFDHSGACRFLRHLWNSLHPDDWVLIGFDLKKDIEILKRAYNDSRGITREFNLNLLHRINRELGSNFRQDRFDFFSQYNVISGAVESWLVSMESQEVLIKSLGKRFHFDHWEGIHTEYSHKYLVSDIERLARETGFVVEKQFFDSRGYFVDSLWRVEKR